MQTACYLIASAAEFAACVQNRKDNLERRLAFGFIHTCRNAAAVVYDETATVFFKCDLYVIAISGERLVNGVIDNLVNQVVQTLD